MWGLPVVQPKFTHAYDAFPLWTCHLHAQDSNLDLIALDDRVMKTDWGEILPAVVAIE